jgi:hypothetical protein
MGKHWKFALTLLLGTLIVSGIAVAFNPTSDSTMSVMRSISPTEGAHLYAAEQILISSCMAAEGFPYWAASTTNLDPQSEHPFGLISLQQAKRSGFQGPTPWAVEMNARYVAGLDRRRLSAYIEALNGPESDSSNVTLTLPGGAVLGHSDKGCSAMAEGRLYSGFDRWFQVSASYEYLNTVRVNEVLANVRYRKAEDRWSACMERRGYSFATPMTAMTFFLMAFPKPSKSVEIETAIADVKCAGSSALSTMSREVSKSVETNLRVQSPRVFSQMVTIQNHAVPIAREILRSACLQSIKQFVTECR